jgi:hypothetical protein
MMVDVSLHGDQIVVTLSSVATSVWSVPKYATLPTARRIDLCVMAGVNA